MDIIISKNLREFRRKRGNTQEELANHLGISISAVSKWERGEGYPDITLLPAIAEFYGVSVDDLLGVGEGKKKEKIDAYTKKAMKFLSVGKTAEAIGIFRELYAEFPNNHDIIGLLAFSIYTDYTGNRENKERLNEVIALEKRILDESTVQSLRDLAISRLCYSYSALGDAEKAREYAEMAGSINSSREVLAANVLPEDERTKANQSLIIQLIALLQNAVYHVGSADWLTRHKLVIGLSELFFEDGLDLNAANAHYYCARIYAGADNAEDKVRYHLEKLAECAKSFDKTEDGFGYTGAIFKDYSVVDRMVVKNGEESFKSLYSRLISPSESPMFDRFRGKDWFKKVEMGLREG